MDHMMVCVTGMRDRAHACMYIAREHALLAEADLLLRGAALNGQLRGREIVPRQ